ncbi:ArgE/DapE family deacylase [Vagococcus fluvialis]|uniref:ArgE/DapE family deacylase n=1 Tax=Vagococcus fluvialis TaxID=2738 RepID=UPI003D121670
MNRTERINILQGLIKIDTTNGNEREAAVYLKKIFESYGISSKEVLYTEERANLVTEVGEGEKILGFSGHLDVVSAGDVTEWTYPPFSGIEIDDRIYGRGATDMKSGLAAMVVAMIELSKEGALNHGKIKLLATVGEEIGLLGARQLTEEGYVDDLDALVIGEPTQDTIVFAHKGVFTYRVKSKGISAHSSMPELGVNAIDKLVVFYNALQEKLSKITEENSILGKFIHNTSIIEGGNQVNSVPEYAELVGNIRTIPEFDNKKTEELFENLIKRINEADSSSNLELLVTQSSYPMFSSEDSEIVQLAKYSAKEILKKDIPTIGISGGTDACEFTRGKKKFPIIIFGPGNDTPHKTDEYVEIQNYLEMIEVYKDMAIRFFKESR